MQSDARMQGMVLAILVFAFAFLFVSSLVNTGNVTQLAISSATQTGARALAPAPTPACTNVLPTTVNGTYVLCTGTYTLTAPISVSANSTLKCQSGVALNYGGTSPYLFDGVKLIGNNASIEKCTFQGKFLNAVSLATNKKNMRVIQNTIDGAQTGIFEEYQAHDNVFQNNTIQNTNKGYDLKGKNGKITGGVIQNNAVGIFTGYPPQITPHTLPGGICSTNAYPSNQCTLPESGKKIIMTNLTVKQNGIGIETYGVDNEVNNSSINKNMYGIIAHAIFVGSEYHYYYPAQLQEYFNAGITINGNQIFDNAKSGIALEDQSYHWQWLSKQYWHQTFISNNTIEKTPGNGQDTGIIIGGSSSGGLWGTDYWEYTTISDNTIRNHAKDGIFLFASANNDILNNTIVNNGGFGVRVGDYSAGMWGIYRYLYRNTIKNNGDDGVRVDLGGAYVTSENIINQNGNRGMYVHNESSTANYTVCNDISYNPAEGFFWDSDMTNWWPQAGNVYDISKNRIQNNGADGIRIEMGIIDPQDPYVHLKLNTKFVERVVNNHIVNNGGKGINYDAWFGAGEFANNIVGNAQGSAYDSGDNTWENEWDEAAYAKAYNQKHCSYGNVCQYDWDCGYSWYQGDSTCVGNVCQCAAGLTPDPVTGTCSCYQDAPSAIGPWANEYLYASYPAPYSPVGNYWANAGAAVTIPPSNAPPLISCLQDSDCPYKKCNLQTNQCGNYDTISSTQAFGGYYYPGIDCTGYSPIIPAFFPNDPPIDPWGGGVIPTEGGTSGLSPEASEWCERMNIPESPNNQLCANMYIDYYSIEKKRIDGLK